MAMAYPSAFIFFVVVEEVQVLLFELTNFIKVVKKGGPACSFWFEYLEQRRITWVLKIQDCFWNQSRFSEEDKISSISQELSYVFQMQRKFQASYSGAVNIRQSSI